MTPVRASLRGRDQGSKTIGDGHYSIPFGRKPELEMLPDVFGVVQATSDPERAPLASLEAQDILPCTRRQPSNAGPLPAGGGQRIHECNQVSTGEQKGERGSERTGPNDEKGGKVAAIPQRLHLSELEGGGRCIRGEREVDGHLGEVSASATLATGERRAECAATR